jgi:sRNA-binding protein
MLETRRLPLEIGIRDKIIATGAIEPDQLKLALQCYCRSEGYLRAMARGGIRIGLAGEPVGAVTPEQAAGAAKGLAIRKARKARKAEERKCSEKETAMPAGPKRLGLADLTQHALARKGATA